LGAAKTEAGDYRQGISLVAGPRASDDRRTHVNSAARGCGCIGSIQATEDMPPVMAPRRMVKGNCRAMQVQRWADSRGGAHARIYLLNGRPQYDMAADGIAEQQYAPIPRDLRSGKGGP
jgi:hypothetical protein